MEKNTTALNYGNNTNFACECDVCRDTGWEIFTEMIKGYDDNHEFAKPCTKCNQYSKILRGDYTGIPKKYELKDIDCFDFDIYEKDMSKLKQIVEKYLEKYRDYRSDFRRGLYLWSETPGSGKTMLACCLAHSISLLHNERIKFVTAPQYLKSVGASYKREQGAQDVSEVYRTCPLLIFDDIGTQKSGDWQEQELFDLVNTRYENGLITFYTSNLPPEKLEVHARTIDRLYDASLVLSLPEISIRNKKARAEQNKLLSDLLAG